MRQSLGDRVSEGTDIIDPRDVRAAADELREERDRLAEHCRESAEEIGALESAEESTPAMEDRIAELRQGIEDSQLSENDSAMLMKLEALEEQLSGYNEDEALISDSYFEEYARRTAEDIHGQLNDQWPYTSIDWARAAEELQQDYSSITYGATDYWQRCQPFHLPLHWRMTWNG